VQAAYDAANEQIQFNSSTPNLTYDANGNLTSQTDANGTTTYTWDARNRLIAQSGPGVAASFTYDALGRRTSKTINGITTQFLYDGNDIVQEIGGGAVGASYLRSLNIDEPFVRRSSSNEFYHTDALGSVLALTNDAGTVATNYSYEAFGKTTIVGTSSNPFQYTGRENDGAGLYYYRARYFSPMMERFVGEDPLHLGSAQLLRQVAPDLRAVSAALIRRTELLNRYSYVINNPIKFIDPLGLVLTSEQHLVVSLAGGVGSMIGTVLVPGAPILGSAVGSAVFSVAAAALLQGTGEDVANAFLGGLVSGAAGGGFAKLFGFAAPNSLQAAIATGVASAAFEALLWRTSPALGAELGDELGPEVIGSRKR